MDRHSEIEFVVKMLRKGCKTRRPLKLYCYHIFIISSDCVVIIGSSNTTNERPIWHSVNYVQSCMRDSFIGAIAF